MGATIFPAHEAPYENNRGVTDFYPESVVTRRYEYDEDYGRMAVPTRYEMHLTYTSINVLFRGIGFPVDADQYSGEYPINIVADRVLAMLDAHHDDDWWDTLGRRYQNLALLCLYGIRHDATLVAWS